MTGMQPDADEPRQCEQTEKEQNEKFFQDVAAAVGWTAASSAASPIFSVAMSPQSRFRVAVINDEISPDFDHACYVASHDFEMQWIELRSMWGTNVTELTTAQIEEFRDKDPR